MPRMRCPPARAAPSLQTPMPRRLVRLSEWSLPRLTDWHRVSLIAPYRSHLPGASTEQQRGWWFCSPSHYNPAAPVPAYDKAPETLTYLEEVFRTQVCRAPHIHAVMGSCSRGDVMVCRARSTACLPSARVRASSRCCAVYARPTLSSTSSSLSSSQVLCATLLNPEPCPTRDTGFRSLAEDHAYLYATPIACPSLHIFGTTDAVIPVGGSCVCAVSAPYRITERSRELSQLFVDAAVVEHGGGHFVPWPPGSSPHRQAIIDFIAAFA
jgi:hypothetical protein